MILSLSRGQNKFAVSLWSSDGSLIVPGTDPLLQVLIAVTLIYQHKHSNPMKKVTLSQAHFVFFNATFVIGCARSAVSSCVCVCVDTDGRMFVVCWWKKDISLSINLSPKKNIRKCSISISSNLIAGPVFLFNKIPTQCEPGQLDMFGWSDPYKTWSNQGAYITPVNTLKYKEIQGAGRLHDWLLLKPGLETSHGLLE